MSFSEIGIILLVGVLILKPEDFPEIAKFLRNIYKYFISIKREIEKEIDKLEEGEEKKSKDLEQINFYLNKIIDMGESYDGPYTKEDIRVYYHKLLLQKRIKK